VRLEKWVARAEYLKLYIFQFAFGNKKKAGDLALFGRPLGSSFLGKRFR